MKTTFFTCMFLCVFMNAANAKRIEVPNQQTTIQAAINAADDGDTVLVAEGRYYENINYKGKAITVASHFILNGDTSIISNTIIDGSKPVDPNIGTVVTMTQAKDTTTVICGFVITGGTGTVVPPVNARVGGGISFNCGKIIWNKIQDNHVEYSGHVYGAGISGVPMSNNTFPNANIVLRHNQIYNNIGKGGDFSQGFGVSIYPTHGLTIIDKNTIYNNIGTCTSSYKAIGGGIAVTRYVSNKGETIISNNHIYGNELHCETTAGGGVYFLPWTGGNNPGFKPSLVYNNIIHDNYSPTMGGGIGVWYVGTDNAPIEPALINNTIYNNKSENGSGLSVINSEVILLNNILWNKGDSEIFDADFSTCPGWCNEGANRAIIHAFKNVIQNSTDTSNYNFDPQLDSITFELKKESPCIGKGTDTITIGGILYKAPQYDLAGFYRNRNENKFVDLGAIQYQVPDKVENILSPNSDLIIYPNPISSTALIQAPNQAIIQRIELIDLTGKVVRFINQVNSTLVTLERTGLTSGVYILKIHADKVYVSKVIVQ